MSSQLASNQDLEQKQTYLRKNIIEQGYDAEEFVNHCISKYGQVDLDAWKIETLQNIVKEFVEQIQRANKLNNEQEKNIPINAIQTVQETDNDEWDYADVPVKQKSLIKSPNKQQNDEEWDDYIDGPANIQPSREKNQQITVSNQEFLNFNPLNLTQKVDLINSKETAKIVFNEADWQIFGLVQNSKKNNSPKKVTSDRLMDKKDIEITKTLSKQEEKKPQKVQLSKQGQKQIKKIKSANNLSIEKQVPPPVKKNKKEKNNEIPYQQYANKRTKIQARESTSSKPLPNFNDIIITKTQQISKGFLHSDFTLYHILFKPTNYTIKRKFNDLRRLRSILHKMYPTFRLPYLQPQGWIHSSSQGKDPEMLSRYSYMAVQFLKYITIHNQQLKNTEIVREFIGLGDKKTEKEKQFVKKVLDDFNRLPKPKLVSDLSFKNSSIMLQPNPNFTKYISNHQGLILQIDLVYEKLKRQLQNLYYFYDQVSKALSDVASTFEQLQGGIAKFNFENGTKDQLRVYDGIKDMFIKFQNNAQDRQNLIKSRVGSLIKYEKQNMWTIRQIIDQRDKIHSQFIRNGFPQHPIIKYPQDIYTVSSTLPLQDIVRGDKNIISIQNNFWQQTCAKQIQGYWKNLRRKINENLSLVSYDELDMENDNLNFWNSMIKKCIL